MTKDKLEFNKENLLFVKDNLLSQYVQLENKISVVLSEMGLIVGLRENQLLTSWLAPVMNSVESEERLKEFLRLILALYRMEKEKKSMMKEINTIETMLDSSSSIFMAAISFDDLEITNE